MSEDRGAGAGNETEPQPGLDPENPEDLEPFEDETEGNPEPEDEPEPEPLPDDGAQQRRPGRAARRIESLANRNAELERRLAALEGRQNLQAQPDPRAAAEAAQREEAQFYESLRDMLPEQQAQAITRRIEQRVGMHMAQAELRGFDRFDVSQFETLRQTSPTAARLAPQVEQILQQRRQGGDYSLGRRQILAFLIGEEALNRAGRTTQQQRRSGARAVARETTRPASGRGGTEAAAGGRRQSQEDADERLLRQVTAADLM